MGKKETTFEAIVVGASVAGSATAGLLARQGLRVLLLDRAHFPRPKICGEGLMPGGTQALAQMGAWGEIETLGRPFSSIRFWLQDGTPLTLDFQEISPQTQGLVISRDCLDHALVRWAQRESSLTFLPGFRVEQVETDSNEVRVAGREGSGPSVQFRGCFVVGADGIHSNFHRWFHIHRQRPPGLRLALRASSTEFDPPLSQVHIHCSTAGEAYLAPIEPDRTRITLILNRPPPTGDPEQAFGECLQLFPTLMPNLKSTTVKDPVQATAPVRLSVSRSHGQRLFLAGDAAGAVDPVTGQGMTLALKDALLINTMVEKNFSQDRFQECHLEPYTVTRNHYFLPSFQLSLSLAGLLHKRVLSGLALRSISRNLRLRKKLLAMTADLAPVKNFAWWDRFLLLRGF